MRRIPTLRRPPFILALALLAACQSMSTFDETAYKNATDLKVETLALIEQADEPASEHQMAIDQLRVDLWKAHEYEKGRKKNRITARMWEVLRGESLAGGTVLVGGFLDLWETQGTMSRAVIDESTAIIEQAFDEIIGLESRKIKPGEADLSLFGITL